MLRESTATPSEPPMRVRSRQLRKEKRGERGSGGGAGRGRGGSPGGQPDISSEPEMMNDSSGEDEPGMCVSFSYRELEALFCPQE